MKSLIVAFAMIAISSVAFAQGAQPLSGPPASGATSQQGTQARTIAQCRDDARNQRLRGDERKNFMRDCGHNIKESCRDQAKAQRLDRDARRDFMGSCMGRPSRNAQRRGTDAAPPAGGTQAPAPR